MLRLQRSLMLPVVQQALGQAAAASTASSQAVALHTSSSVPAASTWQSTSWSRLPWLAAAACSAGAGLVASSAEATDGQAPAEDSSFTLLGQDRKRRIFFKYEKRIREYSSMEKIFEYFSNSREKEGRRMDARDLVRSIVPTYPAHESNDERAGSLDGERPQLRQSKSTAAGAAETRLLAAADIDQDGWISYGEWLLLLALLAIPEHELKAVFNVVDLDGNGEIDFKEFDLVMQVLQNKAGLSPASVSRSGHQVDTGAELTLGEYGIYQRCFGNKGNNVQAVQQQQFIKFLRDLHEELVLLEFDHYDVHGKQSISGQDFATSLVTAAELGMVDKLLDKAQGLPPALARAEVGLQDFVLVSHLRRQHRKLASALSFCESINRKIDEQEFGRLVKRVLGQPLSSHVVQIIFEVFAGPGGDLDTRLLIEVINRREMLPGKKRLLSGIGGMPHGPADTAVPAGTVWSCIKKCAFPSNEEADEAD